jgi:hypothetical protein
VGRAHVRGDPTHTRFGDNDPDGRTERLRRIGNVRLRLCPGIRITLEGTGRQLLDTPHVRQAYLGG